MLTKDRPGIFLGRMYSHDRWHVVDPARPAELEHTWRNAFAPTNAGPIRLRLAKPLAWLSFILIAVALIVAATALVQVRQYFGVVMVLLVGILIAIAVPMVLYSWLTHSGSTRPEPVESVMAIHEKVESWATDATVREDLWEVNLAFARVRFLERAVEKFDPPAQWDENLPPTPSIDAVRAHLAEANAEAREHLDELARRHGFFYIEGDLVLEIDD